MTKSTGRKWRWMHATIAARKAVLKERRERMAWFPRGLYCHLPLYELKGDGCRCMVGGWYDKCYKDAQAKAKERVG